MKPKIIAFSGWMTHICLLISCGIVLSFSQPLFLVFVSILFTMILLELGKTNARGWAAIARRWLAAGEATRQPRYQPRQTDAGRWLEAPVAELDKSTIGKLLASRASRDPSLHVVVRRTPPPVCSDALYDAELDG